jgi:hypothetical protein
MEKPDDGSWRCPYCGRPELLRTRRRWWERILFRLRSVYRYGNCSRRFWRPDRSDPPPRYDKW